MGNVVSDGRRHTLKLNLSPRHTQTWAWKWKRMLGSRKTINSWNLGNSSEFVFWSSSSRFFFQCNPKITQGGSETSSLSVAFLSLTQFFSVNTQSERYSAVVVLWSRRQRNIRRIVLPSYGFFCGEQQRIDVLESLKLRLVYSLYHIPEERNQHY